MEQITSPTIDENETELFNKYCSEWWDPIGPARMLHEINKLLIPYVQESLVKAELIEKSSAETNLPLKGVQILDAGCGGGIVSEGFAKVGAAVVGVDINSNLIDLARKHASISPKPMDNLTYVLEAIENHAKTNYQKYDVVISNFVVEHINEVEVYLKACSDCLKPGGLIFVSTIGQNLMGWVVGIAMLEYVFKYIPKHCHEYKKFIDFSDTEKILQRANCTTKEGRGLLFDTKDLSWFWIKETSALYIIQSIKQ